METRSSNNYKTNVHCTNRGNIYWTVKYLKGFNRKTNQKNTLLSITLKQVKVEQFKNKENLDYVKNVKKKRNVHVR